MYVEELTSLFDLAYSNSHALLFLKVNGCMFGMELVRAVAGLYLCQMWITAELP